MTGRLGIKLKFWKMKPIFLARRRACFFEEMREAGLSFKR